MDTAFAPPLITTVDAVTQTLTGAVYLLVGVAAWVRLPHDVRTRLFLAMSLANVVGFAVPVLAWMYGARELLALPRSAFAALLVSLALASLLLFHFCQVFPRRRPWIRRFGKWVHAGYVVVPLAAAGLIFLAPSPDNVENVAPFLLAVVLIGVPLLLVVGVGLPIGGILSLVRSYREARDGDTRAARRPLLWLLVSQIAGGTLALIFAPVLAVVAPAEAVQTALKVVVAVFGVMTPVAFALSVWKYGWPDQSP